VTKIHFADVAGSVPSSAIVSVLENMPGSVLRLYSEVYLGTYLECTWERTWSVLGIVLGAYLGSYSQAGWKCDIEWNWELRAYSEVCLRAS